LRSSSWHLQHEESHQRVNRLFVEYQRLDYIYTHTIWEYSCPKTLGFDFLLNTGCRRSVLATKRGMFNEGQEIGIEIGWLNHSILICAELAQKRRLWVARGKYSETARQISSCCNTIGYAGHSFCEIGERVWRKISPRLQSNSSRQRVVCGWRICIDAPGPNRYHTFCGEVAQCGMPVGVVPRG
jgi:hypothetical protein